MYYINEPLTQELDPFTKFMGGLNGIIKSVQALNKLTSAPRHWRGTKILVRNGYSAPHTVQVSVYEDDFLVYCNHANQEIEQVSFDDHLGNEYIRSVSVCQKCDAGWDESGEQVLKGADK